MRTEGAGRRRPVLLGVAAVAAYVGVAVATMSGGSRLRPLYDGLTPPPPYRWVSPPKEFAAGNVKPTPATDNLPLGADGTDIRGVATDDGQFVLNLPRGAVAPHEGDTSVTIDVTPLDPASLGPLPPGLRADGNAYRVSAVYQPSGQPVGPLAQPGNVIVTVPEPTQDLLYSPDGRAWTRLSTRNLSGPVSPDSTFDKPGYYLGAAPPTPGGDASPGSSGIGDRVLAVAVITVVLAAGLWFVPAVVRRRRHRRRR
ncbi:MAG: hypothetical protein M3137_01740 [Actinomycetota bacterium]|nr:hypothetical protein [Actinomycetota bacterium]